MFFLDPLEGTETSVAYFQTKGNTLKRDATGRYDPGDCKNLSRLRPTWPMILTGESGPM